MVQVIPGPEAILGPALAQIAGSIAQIAKPDLLFQKQFRNILTQRPELIGQLADVESSAPGTLAGLGLGDLSEVIKGVGPSLNAMLEQGGKEFIGNEANRTDVISKKLIGQTTDERTVTKGRAKVAGTLIDFIDSSPVAGRKVGEIAALGTTQQQVDSADAEANLKLTTTLAATEIIKEGPEVTLDKFLKGDYTNEQMAGILSSPLGAKIKMDFDMMIEKQRLEIARQRLEYDRGQDRIRNEIAAGHLQVAKDRNSIDRQAATIQGQMERLQLTQAAKIVMETGRGTPNGVVDILYGGKRGYVEKELLGKDPATLSPEDKDLLESHGAIQALNRQQRAEELTSHSRDFVSLMNSFKATSRDPEMNRKQKVNILEGLVIDINANLEARSILGGKKYTAILDDGVRSMGFGGKEDKQSMLLGKNADPRIIFKDDEGKTVPEVIIAQPTLEQTQPQERPTPTPTDTTSTTPQLDSTLVNDIVTRLKYHSSPRQRQEELNKLKAKNPVYYDAVFAALQRKE